MMNRKLERNDKQKQSTTNQVTRTLVLNNGIFFLCQIPLSFALSFRSNAGEFLALIFHNSIIMPTGRIYLFVGELLYQLNFYVCVAVAVKYTRHAMRMLLSRFAVVVYCHAISRSNVMRVIISVQLQPSCKHVIQ